MTKRWLVETTVNSDKINWLKNIDNYLKRNPVHLCECVFFQEKKKNKILLNLRLMETVFANHVKLQRFLLCTLTASSTVTACTTFSADFR